MLAWSRKSKEARVAKGECVKGSEVGNDVGWLIGPRPQREAVEGYA